MKRKTFKGILIKRLFIWITVMVVVLFIMTNIALGYLNIAMDSAFMVGENACVNRIKDFNSEIQEQGKDMSSSENLKLLSNFISIYMYENVLYSTAGAIYNSDTKEEIGTSGEIMLLIEKETINEENQIYFGEVKYAEEYCEFIKSLEPVSLSGVHVDYNILLEDYYTKDNEFILGKIQVEYISKETGEKCIKAFDETPDAETLQEYEHIVVADNDDLEVVGPGVYGNSNKTHILEYLDASIACYYLEDIYEFGEADEEYSVVVEDGRPFDMTYLSATPIALSENVNITFYCMLRTNVFDSIGGFIIGFYLVVILLTIIIVTITARLKYVKLRAVYDMEDYRRTMTNSMAHDLKSPLMAISGYAENLITNVNTEKKDYYAQSILDNVNYMNGIIVNILELSKCEDRKIKLNKEQLSVRELFEQAIKKYDTRMEEKKLVLNIDGDVSIKGDGQLLLQAFDNIIGNAVKYCDEKTEIKITISKKKIIVSNACSEAPSLEVSSLWKPFVKGDNSRSNKKGSGIGLAIVKNIVEAHDYKMNLDYLEKQFSVEIIL